MTGSIASPHAELPVIENQQLSSMEFYENKEVRCMEAFVRSEFVVAYAICTPLADLGFRDAQLVTGLLYAYGEGVDKNLRRARIWLKEALKNSQDDAARAFSQFSMD